MLITREHNRLERRSNYNITLRSSATSIQIYSYYIISHNKPNSLKIVIPITLGYDDCNDRHLYFFCKIDFIAYSQYIPFQDGTPTEEGVTILPQCKQGYNVLLKLIFIELVLKLSLNCYIHGRAQDPNLAHKVERRPLNQLDNRIASLNLLILKSNFKFDQKPQKMPAPYPNSTNRQ